MKKNMDFNLTDNEFEFLNNTKNAQSFELPINVVEADKLTPEIIDEYILFVMKTNPEHIETAKVLLQWAKNKKEEINEDRRFKLDEKELETILNKIK